MSTGPDGPVVSTAWLAAHLGEVVIADVRWYLDGRSGRDAYERGHVPGAVWVDLDTVLADPPSGAAGRHPLPDAARFASELGALGFDERLPVAAYDDGGGGAARLVWLLRAAGQRAALLDGGIAAWAGSLETATARRAPVERRVHSWPADALADADSAAEAAILLDARVPERYRGEVEPIDPRAGHIPGAINVPVADTLGPDGRLLGAEELRGVFARAGVQPSGAAPIVSCGSGVTACHVLLALEAAGLQPGRLYAGSWSQWSSDPARPAASGPAP